MKPAGVKQSWMKMKLAPEEAPVFLVGLDRCCGWPSDKLRRTAVQCKTIGDESNFQALRQQSCAAELPSEYTAPLRELIEALSDSRQGGQAQLFEEAIVFVPCILDVLRQSDQLGVDALQIHFSLAHRRADVA